ncbi:hypothetical protein NFI96_025977 [Prochilodus magdalenae]|nr:hypothetical protein NFI96_025977 [Prochilodus magdalenae]
MMLLWVLMIFTQFEGGSAADGIQPLFLEQHVLEGADVSLSCNYSGSYIRGFQWYRQYPGSRPEFLLSLTESSKGSDPARRLTAEAKKHLSCVDLKISSAAVSDSVLYYCALQPTVTGNPDTLYRNWFYDLYYYGLFNTDKAILIIFTESCVSQSISPLEEKVDAVEGQTVTLSCRYEDSAIPNSLQWYRQHPGSRPEYLLMVLPALNRVNYATPGIPRLDAAVNGRVVDLKISSAAVSDAVLYYCAMEPTVTGNPDTLYRNSLQENT